VETKLAEKEVVDKAVEEERHKKNADDREGDTHPMDLDIPGTSTAGRGAETTSSGLGLEALGTFLVSRNIGSTKFHIR
jgi:hypothetical protein